MAYFSRLIRFTSTTKSTFLQVETSRNKIPKKIEEKEEEL